MTPLLHCFESFVTWIFLWQQRGRSAVQKFLFNWESEGHIITRFLQPPFLVPKLNGSFHPVIDLKVTRQHLEVPSFKMENPDPDGRCIICPRMDYQDRPERCLPPYSGTLAYTEILLFIVNSITCQLRVLTFSLFTAHREFTKTLSPLEHHLRSRGIRLPAYLDNWIIMVDFLEEACAQAQQTTNP